jgi:hypothetical protein
MEIVLPQVEDEVLGRYRTLPNASSGNAFRIVFGFSMGGYGAARLAAAYPEKFAAAIIVDGALQSWSEMKRTGVAGNLNTVKYIYGDPQVDGNDGDEGYFNANSPWTAVATNYQAINANRVRFYMLGGDFGGGTNNNYLVNFDNAMSVPNREILFHLLEDTDIDHDLEALMQHPTAARIWTTIQEVFDEAMGASIAAEDGAANSKGIIDATGTSFLLGTSGTADLTQHRGIVSFNLVAVPDNADIAEVRLVVGRVSGGEGDVGSFGNLVADMKPGFFGSAATLQRGDYGSIQGVVTQAATFSSVPTVGSTVEATLGGNALQQFNRAGLTQFRLRFSQPGQTAGTVAFATGENENFSLRPRLRLTYVKRL